MRNFVENPNLPIGRIKHLIIGEKYKSKLENSLRAHEIEPIWLPDNPFIDERLSGHCDLSLLHMRGYNFMTYNYLNSSNFAKISEQLGAEFIFLDNPKTPDYPSDCALNICLVGKNSIMNPGTSANKIVNFLTTEYKIIKCKQSYSRCSVCIVNEDSIITADKSIADNAEKSGLNVLRIQPGFIELTGFEYGFIGGASFKISSDEIVFTGKLLNHPDKHAIESFITERGIKIVYLTDENIFDIGSAVPITYN